MTRAASSALRSKYTESPDPGRLGRSAYHWIHPVMIAGIIVATAGGHAILAHPTDSPTRAVTALVLGGTALFLAGHVLFKREVWRHLSWPRIDAVIVLVIGAILAPPVPALAVGAAAGVALVAIAAVDRYQARHIGTSSPSWPQRVWKYPSPSRRR